jgi:glycosyltransferase involved in cell wall biosynthesis
MMVGGHPDQVEAYRQQVQKIGLESRFRFTGQVWPNLVPLFIEIADILVSPRIEGNNTPLKIYSYLRSGIPVVATDHPTHTQVLNNSVSILTAPYPDAFAEGIISVIKNKALAKEISRNARSLAETRYSFDAYMSKIRAIYQTLEPKNS